MPRGTLARRQVANPEILRSFGRSKQRVYHFQEISRILNEKRDEWDVGPRMTTEALIDLLRSMGDLRTVEIAPASGRAPRKGFTRYIWGGCSPEALALSMRKGSYLTHATAARLHGLLLNPAESPIYVNQEQTAKPPLDPESLNQAAIHRAFHGRQRHSAAAYRTGGFDFVVLNGKNTGSLGVKEIACDGETLPATSIERTLIDIAVRPLYAGGVDAVLEAYRAAVGRVLTARILTLLGRLNYLYPYHQAIGFYMERAGFPRRQFERLKEPGIRFDFHLAHGIKDREYCSEWRLFYPKAWQPL